MLLERAQVSEGSISENHLRCFFNHLRKREPIRLENPFLIAEFNWSPVSVKADRGIIEVDTLDPVEFFRGKASQFRRHARHQRVSAARSLRNRA